ncbi:hypothetical protein EXIGLDRAFT_756174 [Exidia glandulosa HHB12029]|uniref:Uncharacterized protein n=1 Tax=Exidia glandulosa HHB12029 TaxID=1314781 RepID=A0A165BG14_EXIGL|nr:hypothetical protein EXIGLDRAFT_756174 [Exidia glandulosa HHB12029]
MADPVGLASLGLDGVKGAFKHRKQIRTRQRDINALSIALDQAHITLTTLNESPELSAAHEAILAPLIDEGVLFLNTVATRKPYHSAMRKYLQPERDSTEAQRLLAAFNAAPGQIKLLSIETKLRQSETQLQANNIPETLKEFGVQQQTILRMSRIVFLSNLFF